MDEADCCMKRVISENSALGYQTDARNLDSPGVMVEADYDSSDDNHMEDYTPMAHIPHCTSRTSTAGSSLSGEDDDAMNLDITTMETPPHSLHRHADRMKRSDSRASDTSSSGSLRNSSLSGNWGWFEDVHGGEVASGDSKKPGGIKKRKKVGILQRFGDHASNSLSNVIPASADEEAAAMAVTAPNYVLEESLSTQLLWKYTAGNRPPQPVEERAFYEKMWAQNFVRSNVNYQMPVDVLTAASPISLSPFADGNFDENGAGAELSNYNLAYCEADGNKTTADVAEATLMSRMHDPTKGMDSHYQRVEPYVHRNNMNKKVKEHGSDDVLTVLVRGDNVFGTTVSKSFPYTIDGGSTIQGVDTVNISVASYRVVESKKHGKYAQFLVIYREGSIRDTIGVWKRYSDFKDLSKKVEGAHESCSSVMANLSPLHITDEHDVELLPNAITSWRLLKKRQRWYRCLDAGYLSLKVFLLERFLHDILFESSSPRLLRDFVGKDAVSNVSDDDSY